METVMKKLLDHSRLAFQAKQPLILIDTEELELVKELAVSFDLVDLKRKIRPEEEKANKHRPYYTFIGAASSEDKIRRAAELKNCINLHSDGKKLLELGEKGGSLTNSNLPAKEVPASLFILHLTKEGIQELLPQLRQYVNDYLDCCDNSSALRCSCVFLYGDPALLPKDLMLHTEIVPVEYPKQAEIIETIRKMEDEAKRAFENEKDRQDLARELAGFSLMDIYRTLRKLLWTDDVDGQPLIHTAKRQKRNKMLLDIKKQALLKSGGLLELQEKPEDEESKNQLGGMVTYQNYVKSIKEKVLSPSVTARQKGTPPPKGILLCGVPGCGKSEAAKILHAAWDYEIPMLRMDIDRLMGSHVGESERNMREALKQAEAMSPCILWIDELDKGFSGAASSGSSDGGTFKRLFGRLLTWMQENKKPVFIFATANDISQLPDEFFRNGRYDGRFAVFMPTHKECKAIFKEHMRRAEKLRENTAKDYGETLSFKLFKDECTEEKCLDNIMNLFTLKKDIDNPVDIKFVSGADIRLIVNTALGLMKEEQTKSSLSATDWVNLVEEALQSPYVCTHGESSAGLDGIAECYVRLLRGPFVPAADEVLFKKKNYKSKTREYTPEKNFPDSNTPDYDKALYNALFQRMKDAAEYVEKSAKKA